MRGNTDRFSLVSFVKKLFLILLRPSTWPFMKWGCIWTKCTVYTSSSSQAQRADVNVQSQITQKCIFFFQIFLNVVYFSIDCEGTHSGDIFKTLLVISGKQKMHMFKHLCFLFYFLLTSLQWFLLIFFWSTLDCFTSLHMDVTQISTCLTLVLS